METEFKFISKLYRSANVCIICQKHLPAKGKHPYPFCEECRPIVEEIAIYLDPLNPEDYPDLRLKIDTGLMLLSLQNILPEITSFYVSRSQLFEKLTDIPEYQLLCKIRSKVRIHAALSAVMKQSGWCCKVNSQTYYRIGDCEVRA